MKIYIKIDGTLEEQVYTEYGLEAFVGRIGSYWAFLGISVGLMAWAVNKWISCCHKSERDSLELRVARRHRDLLGLQISQQSLINLRATVVRGRGGRRMSLRTQSGKIPSFPAEIQIKPTHFDVWNDNDLAEQPFKVEPRVRPAPKSTRAQSAQKAPIERRSDVEDQLHSMQNEINRIHQILSGSADTATREEVSRPSPPPEEWRHFSVP